MGLGYFFCVDTAIEEKATKSCSVVATYDSHDKAEAAIKQLQHAGYEMKKLYIVGLDYHTDEQVVGTTTMATA